MEKNQKDHPACPAPVRLAFRVSYLGSRFYGSQIQAAHRTVEGEFIAACQRLDLFSDWREAGFLSAGRTDRGVHARRQVIAFTTSVPDRAVQAVNLQLPPDCWCTGYADVPAGFHPRYNARSRTYRYYFSKNPVDAGAMGRAARQFLGSHNFSNFARIQEKNPYRTITEISVSDKGGFTCLEVKAESFLWHQVRCMATALFRIGTGEAGEDSVVSLLGQEAEKPLQPAPAEGLVLWDTDCGILWRDMPVDERSCRYLDQLTGHHALMANVCRVLRGSEV